MNKTQVQIEALILPALNNLEIELVDIQYRKENREQFLRIFIETEAGVSLDTCTKATRAVKSLIDAQNIYYDHLEVSSPGVDRIIKKEQHPERFIGKKIKIKTLKEFTGPRILKGELTDVGEERIILKSGNDNYEVPWDMISVARLNPDIYEEEKNNVQ